MERKRCDDMETLLRDIAQFNRDYTKWQNTLTDVALHEAIQEAKRQIGRAHV